MNNPLLNLNRNLALNPFGNGEITIKSMIKIMMRPQTHYEL